MRSLLLEIMRWKAGLFARSETAIEKFFQNGKPGLGRFAPCVATSTRNAVFGFSRESRITAPRAGFSVHVRCNVRVLACSEYFPATHETS